MNCEARHYIISVYWN